MDNSKPLPAIPKSTFSTLTVDAARHRSRLVRHFLAEIREEQIEKRKEGWAAAIEEALDELGHCFASQDWLRQLRQAQASHKAKQRERQAEGSSEAKAEVGSKEGEKEGKAGTQTNEKSDEEEKSTPSDGSPKDLTPNEPPRQTEPMRSIDRELLLCASLPETKKRPGPVEDRRSGTPAIGCHFKTGHFDGPSNQSRSVLFGGTAPSETFGSRMVLGGTFVFEGITTDAQFEVLCNSLKLAVYVQLSLILEHYILCDSCVPLTFPRPKLPSPPSVPVPGPPADTQAPEALKPRKQNSLFPSGLLSFFSRNALPRSRTITSGIQQKNSSDLGILAGYHLPLPGLSRTSLDIGTSGFRRFSIIGEPPRSPTAAAGQPAEKPHTPYLHTFNQIQGSRYLLSSSPGIDIAPPTLLCQLAHVEEAKHGIRLKGDQKTALSSMLGWDGKEHLGNNMSGIAGFLRHQGISVLVTRAVPCAESSSSSSSQPTSPEASSDSGPGADEPLKSPMISAVSSVKQSGLLMCGQPKWRSYRYYSMENGGDSTLGDALEELVSTVNDPCDVPDCKQKRGWHQLRVAHNKVCITVTIEPKSNWDVSDIEPELETWQSCAVCGAETKRVQVGDGTLMYSCGKYFEMLIYSPLLCSIKPTLCEHTKPPPHPWPHLPFTRFNIIRHFFVKTHVVSFSTTLIDDLHDLKVPRLQIIRGHSGKNSSDSSHTSLSHSGPGSEDDKKQLRKEMRNWWEGVYDHIDNLENLLVSTDTTSTPKLKALPRLPSEDADFHEAATPVATQRWGGHGVPPPSPATASKSSSIFPPDPVTPSKTTSIIDYFHNTPTAAPYAPPPTPSKITDHTVSEKLSNLRFTFQRMEQSLYAQLGRTSISALNDIRRSFHAVARGTEKRMLAWQKKNILTEGPVPEYKAEVDPWWWTEECHAVPGSSVIVREDDWSSLIAYTLSTTDYLIELANMSLARLGSVTTPDFPTPHSSTSTKDSSLFSAALGYKLFNVANQSQPQADPDIDGAVWNEPEMFSATISRFSPTRDTSSIFKDVMRQKSVDVSTLASRSLAGGASRASTMAPPPMAYAKPDIGVSRDGADGEVTIKQKKDEGKETVDKLLSELEFISTAKTQSTAGLYNSPASSTASSKFSKPPSIASSDSQSTIGKSTETSKTSPDTPPLSPKEESKSQRQSEDSRSAPSATTSTIANTLSSGISSAMRFVRRDTPASRPMSPMSPTSKIRHGHGLLHAESANGIEDRPHIKYEWTIGKRMKFTCIVYYAKQFDNLRRRCGIDDSYIQSLATSSTWLAEGGKSKARFRKTSDQRFIIKTLVDAWNVADLQVLLELAPSYFQYMESTASKATSLAKMVGFYTVEIRNVETGVVQSQADLLVMENLFYGHQITKVFDLKGISGRKVKPKHRDNLESNAPKTLFDGEWIEGQQKALVVVKPHSRHVLRCALRNDADFLARSNIMDYSLLVGVEESTKEIVCGIVDTIGSYTIAKTLEYKAKQNLSSGKEPTVMPPAEYQERFINALEGYFVACPDKWSKPEDSARLTHHINELPCVL